MKIRIMIGCLILMLSAFAGSAWAGTEGVYNTFYGAGAGANTIGGGSATAQEGDTFIGVNAGVTNTNGIDNTFVGDGAGFSNTSGNYNTFLGLNAGYKNTGSISTGSGNTFLGTSAGYSNITGNYNTFVGLQSG